jgi:hypothetical protein
MTRCKSGTTRDSERAWAGGFFDGEGSTVCCINNGNIFSRIQMTLGQKDYRRSISPPLIKFQKVVNVGKIYKKTKTGKEINMHQFYTAKFEDVIKCASLLWKYLSIPKKHQFINCANKLKHYTGKEINYEKF